MYIPVYDFLFVASEECAKNILHFLTPQNHPDLASAIRKLVKTRR